MLDLTDNSVISEYQVGQDPKALAITPDGGRVYVANEQSASVSVLTTPFNQVIATIPVGSRPWGAAISR